MKKVYMNLPLEYVIGHLRYGHLEGWIKMTDEEYEKFKEDPATWMEENDGTDEMSVEIDSVEIDDWGPIMWKDAELEVTDL